MNRPNPKMNKNNNSISFIFFYMANKIILNKFITHLNNVMSAFKLKKNRQKLFLDFKGEKKRKFEQKKNLYSTKNKNHKPKKNK